MNRIYMFLCAFLLTFSSYAQESNHLKFKNIPIDGSLNEFVEAMEHKGFSKESDVENGAFLKGDFANLDCEVFVFSTPKSHIVKKVVVYAPENKSWISIRGTYDKLKTQYVKKYGKSSNEMEFFVKPYYDGDGYEMQALESEKSHFLSLWELNKGYISVEISKYCQVCFSYEDKLNMEISSKEEGEIVQNDI